MATPPSCRVTSSELAREEARELGFPVDDFLAAFEGTHQAEVRWRQSDAPTTLELSVEVTGHYELAVVGSDELSASCQDTLLVELTFELSSSDGTLDVASPSLAPELPASSEPAAPPQAHATRRPLRASAALPDRKFMRLCWGNSGARLSPILLG